MDWASPSTWRFSSDGRVPRLPRCCLPLPQADSLEIPASRSGKCTSASKAGNRLTGSNDFPRWYRGEMQLCKPDPVLLLTLDGGIRNGW